MKSLRHNLYSRLILLCAGISALSVIVLGAYTASEQSKLTTRMVIQHSDEISHGMVNALTDELVTENYDEIELLISEFASYPDLIKIEVVKPDGKVIVSANRNLETGKLGLIHGGYLAPPKAGIKICKIIDDKVITWEPVIAGDLVGWVHTELSLQRIAGFKQRILFETGLFAIFAILASVTVAWLSLRKSMFEIKTAAKFAIALPENDGQLLEISSHTAEIENLIEALNSAAMKLNKQEAERLESDIQLRIAATAFESQEGMMITDENGTILRINHAFSKITGYSAEEVIGKNPRILSSGLQDNLFYQNFWEILNEIGIWDGEILNRRKNGEEYPEHLTVTAVKDTHGKITNYVATLTDITNSKAAKEEIERLAFYDSLTQLPNRRLLIDRLKQSLAASARSGQKGALIFLDLDHFKTLNDTLGHDTGDLLLQQVSERLKLCVREEDTVSRFGGDEFVVMLENLSLDEYEAAKLAEKVGEKILQSLNLPYLLGTNHYKTTSSIGITLLNDHDSNVEDLLKQADIAMYQSKKSGRNAVSFFDPDMQASINARVQIEAELYNALLNQQFRLYYQVTVDENRRASGAEALIRWFHPERGMVPPADFIPLAEETGLILEIGKWVLDTACLQLSFWKHDPLTRYLTLSVNVSARQFHQPNFVEEVQEAVRKHEIDPEMLKLELTESMLIQNIQVTIEKMNALNEIGVQLALDDFGTGYSSLQYLKQLPLDQLKIDRSFVRDLVFDTNDQAIVRTIIAMANSMHLNVIAEGVETEEQHQLLIQYGCKHYQGYLFSKPVPIGKLEKMLMSKI